MTRPVLVEVSRLIWQHAAVELHTDKDLNEVTLNDLPEEQLDAADWRFGDIEGYEEIDSVTEPGTERARGE